MKVHSEVDGIGWLFYYLITQEPEEQVQPTVMKTDSGVDSSNYWMVLATLNLPKLLPSILTTYTPLFDDLSCILHETTGLPKYPYCSLTLIGPVTEAAQLNRVSQYQSMSINVGNVANVSYVAMESSSAYISILAVAWSGSGDLHVRSSLEFSSMVRKYRV